jgi:hypothetical protein
VVFRLTIGDERIDEIELIVDSELGRLDLRFLGLIGAAARGP